MKKGFTLIELLAVIVILAVISIITIPMLLNVVEDSRESAFKDSVYGALDAVEYYVVENNLGDMPESGIDVKELNLKNNNFSSGRIIKNTDGVLMAEFVSDGEYCASGTLTNLNINKGECEITSPGVEVVVSEKNATIILVDTYGIVGYAITESSEEPTEWITVEETTGITTTIEAEYPTTYYVHVKNKYGKVNTQEYMIEDKYYDGELPTGEVQVTGLEAIITLKDDRGVVGYAVTKENEEVSEWIIVEETLETTVKWTAKETGTYNIHIKDKYNKTNKNTFVIEPYRVTYIPRSNNETYLGIMYLDPTNLSNQCNAEAYQTNLNNYDSTNLASDGTKSPTGLKSGCMKWYVYAEDEENYTMILDHNIGDNMAFTAATSNLQQSTTGWQVKPRIISADEIAVITGANLDTTLKWNSSKDSGTSIDKKISSYYLDGSGTSYSTTDGWGKQVATTPGSSRYAWLYDYTYKCTSNGCNIEDNIDFSGAYKPDRYIYGYWTINKITGTTSDANWIIAYNGKLGSGMASYSTHYGIRPVISIPKSAINN